MTWRYYLTPFAKTPPALWRKTWIYALWRWICRRRELRRMRRLWANATADNPQLGYNRQILQKLLKDQAKLQGYDPAAPQKHKQIVLDGGRD